MKAAGAVQDVLRSVAGAYGLTVSDLTGPSRERRKVTARQICMYILRHSYGMTTGDVAGALGRLNHTTALHASRSVEEKMRQDKMFSYLVARLCEAAVESADRRGFLRERQPESRA